MIFDEQILLTQSWLYKSNQIPGEFFTPFFDIVIIQSVIQYREERVIVAHVTQQ